MMSDIVASAEPKMKAALKHLSEELASIRTGRAQASLIENINIEVYGQTQPLRALANISTPDAKSLTITPWDPGSASAIEKALAEDQSLGVNPVNDGKNIHLNIPPMTSERREQIVKTLGEKAEETKISLRNGRHEAQDAAKDAKKSGDISEDDYHRIEKELNQMIEKHQQEIDEMVESKKQEVTEI